jgi:hypothetical protein
MRHGQMMRISAKALVAFGMLGLVGACADSTTVAPVSTATTPRAPANYLMIGSSVVFSVNNAEGIVTTIGNHVLSMPAGAICDLQTSGYGKTEWDKPCEPLRGSVVITASIFSGPDGQPYIDFQPSMRFSPDKEVMLFFREGRTDGTKETAVQYCNAFVQCEDESLTDPSLAPFRIGTSSIIGRRVKHFTGYGVVYWEECEGEATPTEDGGWWCEDGKDGDTGMQRKSGYMVASGEDITEVIPDPPSEAPVLPKRQDR